MRQPQSYLIGLIVATLGVAACETNSPSSAVSLTGTVRETGSNSAISGATVTVQNKTATSAANGTYTVSDLTAGNAEVRVTHQGHVNVTQNVALSGATTLNPTMTVEPRLVYAGNWTGTWVNTTSQNKGTGTLAIGLDTIAQSIQFTLDLNGLVFGIPDPPAQVFSAAYTATGVSVSQVTPFGTITATIAQGGQVTGNIQAAAGLPITRVDFTGTATPNNITLNFTITFPAGPPNTGVITFTK